MKVRFGANGKRLVVGLMLAAPPGVMAVQKTQPMPPVEVRHRDGEWGREKWDWEGVAVVTDSVSRETLFLGGQVGGAAQGAIGNWALAEDGKTWREITCASATLDPLRDRCLAARRPAKDGEAAARNVFYAGCDAAREAEAVKDKPAALIDEALRLAGELSAALAAAQASGWEAEGIARARPLVDHALAGLRTARDGFQQGRLDASLLKACFDAQWALDEAAADLASAPGPRRSPSAAFDPDNRRVLLFGGSHGDYMLSDTWLYDCATRAWRQVWPRMAPTPRMAATLGWADDRRLFTLTGGKTVLNKMVYQQCDMPAPEGVWTFDERTGQWTGDNGVDPGARAYRTLVPGYNPCWYDAAPRGDAATVAAWLAALEPNTWTAVPTPPARAPEREWGTAVFDPDRDQIYRWSGGHQADPSDLVSTYHSALNRWSIPHVAGILGKGMGFDGRPDCQNHTYLHYAYDPVSRRLVCTAMGGTAVYNPDRRDFDFNMPQPFNRQIYETCLAGTPAGVVVWGNGFFGVLDVKAREWRKLPVAGTLPRTCCDGSAISYDSKRNALWLATFANYQKPSGNIWRYDMQTGAVEALNPANADAIARARGFNDTIRESVYLPTADLVMFNNFVQKKQAAYDPAQNRWVVLNIAPRLERQGSVSDTLVYDAKRGCVWNLNAYGLLYVIRIDAARLTRSGDPAN